MPALVVIPARYESTRFPGKALAPLNGKPLIQHVYENSRGSKRASEVLVATDSRIILEAVESFGGNAVLTSPEHPSGTDRIAEAASKTEYDIIVNVQGDEPLMKPEMIDSVIALLDDERASMGTLAVRIGRVDDILDPNAVKVVFDGEGFALYFSRAPIPYHRTEWDNIQAAKAGKGTLHKHIGIYSYRREVLMRLTGLEQSKLERVEMLEQLRALENGMRIKVGLTAHELIGVDTPEDLERVKRWLSSSS